MNVMSNGKVRRTAAEWRTIFARFDGRDCTDRVFCDREAINLTSFRRWRGRLAPDAVQARPVDDRFIEVNAMPPTPPTSPTIELKFPDGRILRIYG